MTFASSVVEDTVILGSVKGANAPFPPFDVSTFVPQLFWLLVCFLLLYICLAYVFVPRLFSIFEKRKNLIAKLLSETEIFQHLAQKALSSAEKTVFDAKSKYQVISKKALEQGSTWLDSKKKSLDQDISTTIKETQDKMNKEKKEIYSKIDSLTEELGHQIYQKITGLPADRKIIENALSNLPNTRKR